KTSANPDSLTIVSWNSQQNEQLPGYTEEPKHKLTFTDDPEHCRCGSMTVDGEYVGKDGGELLLSRDELDVLKHRVQEFPSDSICEQNARPYKILREEFESK